MKSKEKLGVSCLIGLFIFNSIASYYNHNTALFTQAVYGIGLIITIIIILNSDMKWKHKED